VIIAGAGGHGREVLYSLILNGFSQLNIYFFDEDESLKDIKVAENSYHVISDLEELRKNFSVDPDFYLGVGNPVFRKKFVELLSSNGGGMRSVMLSGQLPTLDSIQNKYDSMPYSFIGSGVNLGIGVLINTGAQVHHDSQVGDYTEIGPKAMLLGGSKVGKMCRIGAGAVILPGVELADEVIVGAGAVVTKSVIEKSTLVGIPAKPVSKSF